MKTSPTDILADAAIAQAHRRAMVGVELVAAIVADPMRAVEAGKAAGLRVDDVDADDLRIILNAWRTKLYFGRLSGDRYADKLAIAMLARTGLRAIGRWDNEQPAGNWNMAARWSDASLSALFCSTLFSAEVIASLVQELQDIDRRQNAAHCAYHECLALLAGNESEGANMRIDARRQRGAA